MKILIITQKADREDDIFGFVHRWIEKFAKKADFVNVICLLEGKHQLPSNVKVWSLGKEGGRSRIKYVFRFYKYIFSLRNDYDGVFVHMNPVYAALGGIPWKIMNKKIFLWHNHHFGNLVTRIGIFMADTAFCTSKFSFVSRFKKAMIMPAGIDTEIFHRDENIAKKENSILFVGRISPIKNIELLIEAVKLLDADGRKFTLNIVGEPAEQEVGYFKKLKDMAKNLEAEGKIKFLGKIPNYKTPSIYNQNEIFVNLSPAGLFDKTILEAMACKTLPLVSSKAFADFLPDPLMFKEGDVQSLKEKILGIFAMTREEKESLSSNLRNYIKENHDLNILVDKIISEFKK